MLTKNNFLARAQLLISGKLLSSMLRTEMQNTMKRYLCYQASQYRKYGMLNHQRKSLS